ncbi:MAG: hypothetical protein GY704_04680 [Phycisphaeraceae bacterium]|nr:hypothetical protein [Phycisphaeraceae bacterium]
MRHGTHTARLARRVAAAVAAVTTTLTLVIAPVAAQPSPPDPGPPAPLNPVPITPACPDTGGGGAGIDQLGGAVLGTCWGNTPGSGPDRSISSALVWQWYQCDQWRPFSPGSVVSAVTPQGELFPEDVLARGLDPTVTYVWHTIECTHVEQGAAADGGDVVAVWGWGFLVIGTTPPVDPLTLRDIAAARIDPEPPTPATAPMWGEVPSVVNMTTWLWLTDDWEPVEEQESEGFVTVVVQARPVETAWETGDGATVVCPNGPGVAWSAGMADGDTYCSHTFAAAGSGLAGSATTTWTFRWWLNGNDMGDFGDFTRTTPVAFDVTEIQAIETGS